MELSAYEFSTLRDGAFTLSRGLADGLAPILLVAPAATDRSLESLERLEHEFALRTELDPDWAARPLELVGRDAGQVLVLEDRGGEPLERLLGRPMDIGAFLRVAIPLSAAVGYAHARGLIHKDVKPGNILVDMATGAVWLTGFGIASRVPREHQPPAPPEVIAGTLEYMAPEQTGRMNRSVDSRSDLYALGATFYQMLTGALPFTASDPMEYVHCHIARQPTPPEEREPGIPPPLSAMVLKLLAKTAEERYQTAVGLTFDLRLCLAEWNAFGRIDAFSLGGQDVSDRLLIPERLYGREREIDTLVTAFDRVVSTSVPELVLVSGYSGVGKSSVVNELHKVLVPPRGLFASGKFDQYRRDVPYATLAQAFQSLVRPLLGQSDAELGRWREALRNALGENGQLVVNLIPDIELVIGKQPPVPELSPQDAQSRFQLVFRRLIGVFARPEHPLALFLDDLQWLDAGTLALVEHLITHREVRHLLLVGAYRDNEVDPAHPLMRTLQALRTAGAQMQEIVLAPLEPDDVCRLVADSLHCEFERAQPPAQLVHDKTGGNAFFAIQFLTALVDDGLMTFDPAAAAWHWDIARIRARSYTDNVVELMAGKLKRLSEPTQEALKHLACLGNVAEVATLALIYGGAEETMHAALWEAVRAGLVFRQEGTCRFLHDRIQQAAYSLIPDEQRAATHLHIGRVLLASMAASPLTEHLFEVANQLNRGAAMLAERNEMADVVEINLRAGRQAKASAAYASACAYLAAGMTLLDDESWDSHHELTVAVCLERAECELLSGGYDTAEQLIAELLRRATSRFDQAAAYRLKVELHITRSEKQQAVASALTCLRLFGVDLPEHPSLDQVQAEYDTFLQTLGPRAVEDLIDLPLMTDREMQAVMQILSALLTPSYHTDFNLWCLQVGRMVNISIRHGTTGASSHAYGFWGVALALLFHRYRDGYRFAKLACDLVEKHGLSAYRARASYSMGTVAWWTQPLSTAIECMRAGARTARETAGDVTVVGYGLFQSVTGRLARNDPLDEVWRESQSALDFVRKNLHLREAKYGDAAPILVSQQRFIATMQGRTGSFSSFNDAHFDEVTFERELGTRMSYTIAWYWILKLKARFLSGDYAEALAAADTAKTFLSPAAFLIQLLDYHYYAALAAAALHENASADDQNDWRERLTTHRDQLREWAETYPPTFADKHALVSAEIARLEGRDVDAMRLYDEAIRSARQHGFVQHEGVALEVAARFYATHGVATVAHACRRNARDCYRRWGAEGKVRQLEQVHPELRSDPARAPSTAMFGASVAQLDIGAVVKASHAIAGEIMLGQLVRTLMTIALEDAGADRGLLILLRDGQPQIEAEATIEREKVEVRLRQDPVSSSELPESLLHTVIRTRESVILGDAAAASAFSADAYIRERRPRSILCLPLIKQATFIGVLYLENHLASHVFTPDRLSVLELLSSQAAISLENARLYADLLEENRDRKRAEEALRDVQAELARAARLAMMGELTASIAHEINQPLAAIASNGAAGLRWLNRATPELDEVRAALAHVVSDATRAADVIRGLRALANKTESRLTALDIDDAIDEVLALTRSEVQRHDVVLRTRLTIGDQPVLGDRVQLQQVVLNLILNGIEAVRAVADRVRELTVSSAVAGPGIALVSVEDSGAGVDPTIAQRMFEPFVTTKPYGLGMGLSICRSIIEAHRGRLGVSPGVPHGTVFHFTVPLAEAT